MSHRNDVPNLARDARRILEDEAAIAGSFLPLPENPTSEVVELNSKLEQVEASVPVATKPESESEPQPEVRGFAEIEARLLSLIPQDSPLHELTTLEQIAEYVANTILVPIDEARINPVPGVGNPNADLMVIGEAPGADEDKRGEPFVGRAGQLLDKILAAVDFSRSEVFIANILKSRPPGNRDPEPTEIKAHIPILLRQITLVQPRLLLCVGRVAGNVITGQNSTLKGLRQQNFHDFHGIPLMVTYHPAALLRGNQFKRPTWEDVQVLRARFDELVTPDAR